MLAQILLTFFFCLVVGETSAAHSYGSGFYYEDGYSTKALCKGCRGDRQCCQWRKANLYRHSGSHYPAGYSGSASAGAYYPGHSGSASVGQYPSNSASYSGSAASSGAMLGGKAPIVALPPGAEAGGLTTGQRWINIDESYSRDVDIYENFVATEYAANHGYYPAPAGWYNF